MDWGNPSSDRTPSLSFASDQKAPQAPGHDQRPPQGVKKSAELNPISSLASPWAGGDRASHSSEAFGSEVYPLQASSADPFGQDPPTPVPAGASQPHNPPDKHADLWPRPVLVRVASVELDLGHCILSVGCGLCMGRLSELHQHCF